MNHKHIQVIIEDLTYSQSISEWDAINDLIDYTECVERGKTDEHYKNCILNEGQGK